MRIELKEPFVQGLPVGDCYNPVKYHFRFRYNKQPLFLYLDFKNLNIEIDYVTFYEAVGS